MIDKFLELSDKFFDWVDIQFDKFENFIGWLADKIIK
jgi:hypothetical protein